MKREQCVIADPACPTSGLPKRRKPTSRFIFPAPLAWYKPIVRVKSSLLMFGLLSIPQWLFASTADVVPKRAVHTVGSELVMNWSLGLLIVLGVFFLCIFLLRKANKFSVTGSGKMTVLGGLSLGMREKVILLQVGEKQLILGVTPGRIETLHVLEGEDCLNNDQQQPLAGEASSFSQIIKLAMKGNTNA